MDSLKIAKVVQVVTDTPLVPRVRMAVEWKEEARALGLKTRIPGRVVEHFARCRTGAAQCWWMLDGSVRAMWVDRAGRLRTKTLSERDLLRLARTVLDHA